MLLDDEKILLKAGDILVQRGTNHAWLNRGEKPARLFFVLVDAQPKRAGPSRASAGTLTSCAAPPRAALTQPSAPRQYDDG